MEERRGLTGSTLKIIAMVSMLIDHTAAIVLDGHMNPEMVYGLRLIGRFAFPIFAFLIVEGFLHTHSLKKYARNLLIFALISEIPFNLAFGQSLLTFDYQNVIFTMLIGLLTLAAIRHYAEEGRYEKRSLLYYPVAVLCGLYASELATDCVAREYVSEYVRLEERNVLAIWCTCFVIASLIIFIIIDREADDLQHNRITYTMLPLLMGMMAADILNTDYRWAGVLTIAVMYLLKGNRQRAFLAGCLVLIFFSSSEATTLLMLIPLSMYNGRRGLKMKYVFYAFYPVHILLLYLIALYLGWSSFTIF